VVLRGRVRGNLSLHIMRRQVSSGRETVVAEWHSPAQAEADSEYVLALPVPIAAPADGESYLFLEITAAPQAMLLQLAWEADQAPLRKARLGLAITTFECAPFLQANLARLTGRVGQGRVIVVNHGRPGLEQRIDTTGHCDNVVRFIDQENTGGAGGFTRGMLEHSLDAQITHVLLMDDDIDLPADLVERASAILSFTDRPVCLGGAMFDYHERHRLFSAGDYLVPGSFGIGHIAPMQDCDIRKTAGVDFLARRHAPDFNGWWCFAFPVEAIASVGLPMPCFIRGDDVEYGYRLKREGWPTRPWPGLAVWHMPFSEKSAPWHMFYDRRNSLFANAIHDRLGLCEVLNKLIGGFIHHLLRYDYDRVRAMTMGIEAYNAGTQALSSWTSHDHAALIAATSTAQSPPSAPPPATSLMQINSSRLRGVRRTVTMAGRFVSDLVWPWRDRHPRALAKQAVWRPDLANRPANIVETASPTGAPRIYAYRWQDSVQATGRAVLALAVLALRFNRARRTVPQAEWLHPTPLLRPGEKSDEKRR